MDEVNVSQASKFNWLKNKVNLDVVPSSKESSKRLLIGKILSKKSFPKALVKEILTKAWNVLNEVEVSMSLLSPNLIPVASSSQHSSRRTSLKDQARVKAVSRVVRFKNGKAGRASGLALFWSLGVELEVMYSDKNMITALVYSDPPNSPWLLFAIYGPCRRNKRIMFWEMLENMVLSFSGPWIVIGDLNCIKRVDEKRGGRSSLESSINCLRDFMANTGAIDLGFNGPSFTWSNRCEGLANIKERLDQCLCDREWQILFPKAGVKHLSNANSDHNPSLKISTALLDLKRCVLRMKGVELWWRMLGKQKWRKPPTKPELEASLNLELDDWLTKEELRWKQKSRELWLKEGDRNSRFFHLSTLIRRRRNRISEIKLDDGSWINNRVDIQDCFRGSFNSLYQSSNPQIPGELENLINPCISDEENDELCRIPSRDEIKMVAFGMKSLKAPGPDGFPALFYKHYWRVVGDQMMLATQSFFRNGWMLKSFNQTYISLIPKRNGACNFNQFRPIGLCNVCYKIITKILGDPLSPYLFILGSEVLMRFVNREVDRKNISPVKVACTAPAISKLCYADDVILFCKAKISELASLKIVKYKIRHNWLSHISHGNSSPIWKSLAGVKHLFSNAACMIVRDGNTIRIWDDPWIPDLQGFIPKPKVGVNLSEILLVSQLLNSYHNAWDIHKLKIRRLLAKFQNSKFAKIVSVRPTELFHAWSPPRRFSIKINVDVAIGLKFSAVAAVARDWRGRLANMAAHSLAKWSLSCNVFGSFDIGCCPPIFAFVVRDEVGS
uniref:Reverse transcriptase n=1 Tax=Quercus lobata TaxID=97700 RepID=A0A7N2L3I4_QUELO